MSSIKYDEVAQENVETALNQVKIILQDAETDLINYFNGLPSPTYIDSRIRAMARKTRTVEKADGTTYEETYVDSDTVETLNRLYREPLIRAMGNVSTSIGNITEMSSVAEDLDNRVIGIKGAVEEYYSYEPDKPEQETLGLGNGTPTINPYIKPTGGGEDTQTPESTINIDINGDGTPDINIDTDGDGEADLNIDINGDGIPDINIDTDGDNKADLNIDINGDGKPDINIDTDGDGEADLNIDTNGDGKPDINIDTDGDNKADLNIDINGDGKPDINIDSNGDGKPDLNIDTNGDGKPDINIDTNGDGTADLNIDTNGDGKPDVNIDTNGDGKADLNLDTNGDGKPDVNLDTNGDGKADLNIDTNGDGTPDLNIDSNGDGKPDLNIDTDGDGIPDLNIDTDGDGIPDLNIDTDGDGKPDKNIDTDGDGIADENLEDPTKLPVNVDTDGDGIPDVNIDTDGDGNPDINIDLDGDGIPDLNIDTDSDGLPDENIVPNNGDKTLNELLNDGALYVDDEGNVYMINEDGTITYPFAPGGLFYNQMLTNESNEQLGSLFGSHNTDSSKVEQLGIGFDDESVKSSAAIGGMAAVGVAAANAAATLESVAKEQKEGVRGKDDKNLSPEEIKTRKIRTIISGIVLGVLTVANLIALLMSGTSTVTIVLLGIAIGVTSVITSFGNKYGKIAVPIVALVNLFMSFVLYTIGIAPMTGYIMSYIIVAIVCIYYYYIKIFEQLAPNVDFVPVVAGVLIIGLIGLLMVTGLLLWWLGLIFVILTIIGYFAYNYFGLAQIEEENEKIKKGNKVSFSEMALPPKKIKTINGINTFNSMKESMTSGGVNENKATSINNQMNLMNNVQPKNNTNDLMKPMDNNSNWNNRK